MKIIVGSKGLMRITINPQEALLLAERLTSNAGLVLSDPTESAECFIHIPIQALVKGESFDADLTFNVMSTSKTVECNK